jgi:hypothetical protein
MINLRKRNPMTTKLDLYKTHKAEYVTPRTPALVGTKPAQYLAMAGEGAPGNARFQACIGALYGIAFTVKMKRKFDGKQDYAVCKLEAIYDCDLAETPKDRWKWRLMIRTPDFVSQKDLNDAVATLLKRGKPVEVKEVVLQSIDEGDCVQMLHIGPYEKEQESTELMRRFAEAKGLKLAGAHHEIYLSDPRRVPPERLRTILRQPVRL